MTGPEPRSAIERAKRQAAYRAVEDHFNPEAQYIGIGSGSTVVYVVEAIAAKGPDVTSKITFIPTGYQSRELITGAGLRLGSIDSLVALNDAVEEDGGQQKSAMLDVAFDGADEVDEELNLIKGGGACLFQEKLVAISARKFICVADSRKLQPRLLTQWPAIPIEVVPPAAPHVLRALRSLGSTTPRIRTGGTAKAGPIVTDNGNLIIDAPFSEPLLPTTAPTTTNTSSSPDSPPHHHEEKDEGQRRKRTWHVDDLATHIKLLVGVVETGLFCGSNGHQAQSQSQALAATTAGNDSTGGSGGATASTAVIPPGQKPVAAYFGDESGAVRVLNAAT